MAHSLAIEQQHSQAHHEIQTWILFSYGTHLDFRLSKCSAMMIVPYHVRWGTILTCWRKHCVQLNDQHATTGKELTDDFETLERLQKDLFLVWVLGPSEQRSSSAESEDLKENGSSMTFVIVLAVGKVNGDVATFRHTCEGCPCKLFADLRVAIPFTRAGGSFSNTFRRSFSNTEQFWIHFYCQGHHFGSQEAGGHFQTHVSGHFPTQKHNPCVIFKHRHTFWRQGQYFHDVHEAFFHMKTML